MQTDIAPEQQQAWFAAFSDRSNDLMFVVEQYVEGQWAKIGCMGFRHLENEGCVDAYNIIRSRKIEPAGFTFADPFRLMLAYAHSLHPELPIRCKVLAENPAVNWYERNGFSQIEGRDGFVLMELDLDTVQNIFPTINDKL